MSPHPAGVVPSELVARVEAWMAQDPDPGTRGELAALLEGDDKAALRDRFDHPVGFGTAGLRGPLGAGPGRMNRAVVRKTTAGLVRYLLAAEPAAPAAAEPAAPAAATEPAAPAAATEPAAPAAATEPAAPAAATEPAAPAAATEPAALAAPVASAGQNGRAASAGVVIGHDARHYSADFADDTARVVAAGGLRAWRFRSALPTPITAFAVRHLQAAAGVMVTASHNPAPDNGYKVYLSDGAQVFPPHDAAIASAAAECAVPSDAALSGPFGQRLVEVDEAEVLAAYRRAVLAVVGPSGPRRLRSVYTPVHGVGGAVLPGLLEEAGFDRPTMVAAQAQPDPDFPTAPFPNPEEPGVLDLALAEAERVGADLVLANDPDADRLAVAVPSRAGDGFRVLSGDELGGLIADHLISTTSGADRLVATTVVSSSMLSALAERAGVAYVETLTGFKWIARAARLRPGHRLLFGYEEALGYAVSDAVADKDGLSAALVVADMVARDRAEGRSLLTRLDDLDASLGVHATAQLSVRLPGSEAPDALAALMARWRSSPPSRLAGLAVTGVRDLAQGEGELPPSDLLILQLGAAGRVVLRPSGTEPKLKVYLEATTSPCAPEDLTEARREAKDRLGALGQEVDGLLGGLGGARAP